jgi:hypothetical protein
MVNTGRQKDQIPLLGSEVRRPDVLDARTRQQKEKLKIIVSMRRIDTWVVHLRSNRKIRNVIGVPSNGLIVNVLKHVLPPLLHVGPLFVGAPSYSFLFFCLLRQVESAKAANRAFPRLAIVAS